MVESDMPGHVFFDKFFWAFGPSIEAFPHFRYVLNELRTVIPFIMEYF